MKLGRGRKRINMYVRLIRQIPKTPQNGRSFQEEQTCISLSFPDDMFFKKWMSSNLVISYQATHFLSTY